MQNLKLNLLDNGIDFILNGIDELFAEGILQKDYPDYIDPEDLPLKSYKYGTLHLFSGFLLLLKERLVRHSGQLIFTKKSKTINFDQAIERLKDEVSFTFSADEMKVIKTIQEFRNTFEHYEVSADQYQLWSTVYDFLALIDKFLVQELSIRMEASAGAGKLQRKIQQIKSVWERVQQQYQRDWLTAITEKNRVLQESVDQVHSGLKGTYISEKGLAQVFTACPECGEDTLIIHGEFAGICLNEGCNEFHHLTLCFRCGVPIIGWEWEENMCEGCRRWEDEE